MAIRIGLLLFLLPCVCYNSYGFLLSRPSTITFQNNAYKNVIIAISENVPEDQGLIDKIKTAFTATSKSLYSATRKRAYFKQIYILVPHTWSSNPSYGAATTQTLQLADIVISAPIQRHQRHVMTRSYSGCGKTGIHLQLLTDFITNPGSIPNCAGNLQFFNRLIQKLILPSSWKPAHVKDSPRDVKNYLAISLGNAWKACYTVEELIGRNLVHAWANFRWGVYNEFPSEGETQFYFSTQSGRPEAVRCAAGLRGSILKTFPNGTANVRERCLHPDPNTGMFEAACKYFPYPYRNMAQASIMDQSWISDIKDFCDDDPTFRSRTAHNVEPPNKHNRLCSHRSTWDVITNTPDFKNNINPPRNITASELVPQFIVVRASSTKRIAVVMDTNSKSQSRIQRRDVHQAVNDFIHKGVDVESAIALIQHGEKSSIVHPLTRIHSYHDRQNVIGTINKTEGITKKGSGIKGALEVLKTAVIGEEKHIVLINCGNSTNAVDDATKQQLLHTGVMLHVISCENSNHWSLVDASKMTGGQYYHVTGANIATSLLDGIHEISKLTSKQFQRQIQLLSKSVILSSGTSVCKDDFIVEHSLNGNMEIIVAYNSTMPLIYVVSPSGRSYTDKMAMAKHDSSHRVIRMDLSSVETGTWTFTIANREQDTNLITAIVAAQPAINSPPIQLHGHVRILDEFDKPVLVIFAEINKGVNHITGLTVTATIETPDGVINQLPLLDNGAGADIEKNDGVYTRYFTMITEPGHYNVKIEAQCNEGHLYEEVAVEEHYDNELNMYMPRVNRQKRSVTNGISRSLSGTIFMSENMMQKGSQETTDTYPPARITDLRVVNVSQSTRTITLEWTAPGDDLDKGTAFAYDIRYDQDGINLLRAKDNAAVLPQEFMLDGPNIKPKSAGHREEVALKFPTNQDQNVSFAFIIRAIDKNGNAGAFSNLATAGFVNPRKFEHIHTATSEVKTRNVGQALVMIDNVEIEKTVEEPVALIIAILMVFIFCLFIMLMVRFAHFHDEKDSRKYAA